MWSIKTLTPKPCVWHRPVCSHHQHKNAASLLSNHFVYKTESSLESLITPYYKHSFHFKEEIFFSYLDLDIVYSWIRQLSSVSSCVHQKLWFFYRLCIQERFVSKQCFCWFYCWFCCLSSQKKRFFNMEGMVHTVITTLYHDSFKVKIILSGFSIHPIFWLVCNMEKLSSL